MKKYTLRSKTIHSLNIVLSKLALNENVRVTQSPLHEEDGNFVSVIQTDTGLDTTKLGAHVDIIEDLDAVSQEKEELQQLVITKLKDSLRNNNELQDLLDKINDINSEDDKNIWVTNDEGNTAILAGKNAKIFKQHNNLCLSYKDKVEIFKSIDELHSFLNKNNMPLPKNIKLHEDSNQTYFDTLATIRQNKEKKVYDKYLKQNSLEKNDDSYAAFKAHQTAEIEQARAEKEKDDKEDEERIYKSGYSAIPKRSPWFKIIYKDFDMDTTMPAPSAEEIAQRKFDFYQKKVGKMGKDEWREKIKTLNTADFDPQKDANREKKMENPKLTKTRSIFDSAVEECFGGAGATIGTALSAGVQYLANKKEEALEENNETLLKEKRGYGYATTPFVDHFYKSESPLVADYLSWIYTQNNDGTWNVDSEVDKHLPSVLKGHASKIKADYFDAAWQKFAKTKQMYDPTTGEQLVGLSEEDMLKELRARIGDHEIDSNNNIASKRVKTGDLTTKRLEKDYFEVISPQNKEAKEQFKSWWQANILPGLLEKKLSDFNFQKNKAAYEQALAAGTVKVAQLVFPKQSARPSKGWKYGPGIDSPYNAKFSNNAEQLSSDSDGMTNLDVDAPQEISAAEKMARKRKAFAVRQDPKLSKIVKNLAQIQENIVAGKASDDDFEEELFKAELSLSPNEIVTLCDYLVDGAEGIKLNKGTLEFINQLKDEAQQNVAESVSFTEAFNILLNEDDSPEDFATGVDPVAGDTTPDTAPVDDGSMGGEDIGMGIPPMDNPMGDGMDGAGDFGGVSISGGGGSYAPDAPEGEMGMPVPTLPDERIVDVLVNPNNEAEILVKVKNEETGEISTKNLYELDV